MKKYLVSLAFTTFCEYVIEAENEDRAIDDALENYHAGYVGEWSENKILLEEAHYAEEMKE